MCYNFSVAEQEKIVPAAQIRRLRKGMGINMKKLGLVGGTGPESTLVYYKEINRLIHEKTGGQAFPEIAVESVDLYKALGFVGSGKY